MSDEKFNYYKIQLDRVNVKSQYVPTLKIWYDVDGSGGETKNLSINLESIPELRKFLDRIEAELKARG